MSEQAKCPVVGATAAKGGTSNRDWWPNHLNLKVLQQHAPAANPLGDSFDYAKEFKKLDLKKLKKEIYKLMTTSQEWWPADYVTTGHSLFAWLGTVQVPIEPLMDVAAPVRVCNALLLLTLGQTT